LDHYDCIKPLCSGDSTAEEKKKILQPGDYICGAEELAAGSGTYNVNDEIRAAVLGEYVQQGHEAAVKAQKSVKQIKIGDEVYGIVTDAGEMKALVAVVPISAVSGDRYPSLETAAIMVQHMSERYVRSAKDEFRAGDIIKARVVSMERGLDLTTKGSPDYGVLKAFCTRCRHPLRLKGSALICEGCGRTERRRIAKGYVLTGE
jgi:exosome complex component CSL4